jgi:hypothetical protein
MDGTGLIFGMNLGFHELDSSQSACVCATSSTSADRMKRAWNCSSRAKRGQAQATDGRFDQQETLPGNRAGSGLTV